MLSYWEKSSLSHYEFAIIGSGFVGLHTALQVRKKYPTASIVILERGLLPYGASTKNAGFACTGSLTEILDDLHNKDEATVLSLFQMRKDGLAFTRQLLGDDAIGYKNDGSHELITEAHLPALEQLENINNILQPITGTAAFTIDKEHINNAQFNNKYFLAAIKNNCEGSLDTGLLMRALLQYVLKQNIIILTGCEVQNISESESHVSINCKASLQEIELTATQLFYCTNAFTEKFLPMLDLEPGRGTILVTKPIKQLPFKGIYHFDEGYFYFRQVDNRILLGGGRNLDKAGEATSEFGTNEKILSALQKHLTSHIAPNLNPEIDYHWSGIMAFGQDKSPIIQQISNRTYCAVRCGGMGVAIAPMVAKKMVELL